MWIKLTPQLGSSVKHISSCTASTEVGNTSETAVSQDSNPSNIVLQQVLLQSSFYTESWMWVMTSRGAIQELGLADPQEKSILIRARH